MKNSKFTILDRCLNVPFKLNDKYQKVACGCMSRPLFLFRLESISLSLLAQPPRPASHQVTQDPNFIVTFYFSSLCSDSVET